MEILKESNQSHIKAYEHLESQFHNLSDKFHHVNSENNILKNKNKRLWETVESLEKKSEDLKFEIEKIRAERENEMKELSKKEVQLPVKKDKFKGLLNRATTGASSATVDHKCPDVSGLESNIKSLQENIKDLKVQQNMDRREKKELEAELNDVVNENEMLLQRINDLERETEEWQNVAQRANEYRKLADKYCSDLDIFANPTFSIIPTKVTFMNRTNLSKAVSCEVLNRPSVIEQSDTIGNRKNLSLSATHLYQPKNFSVLSELDNRYHELVSRYEKVFEKCRQDGKISDDPSRAKRVQRAIQTLSWDLTSTSTQVQFSPLGSPDKSFDLKSRCSRCELAGVNTSKDKISESHLDYRKLFAQIFATLKASRNYDPSMYAKEEGNGNSG